MNLTFKFLTSETRYSVDVPSSINSVGEWYGVVTSEFAVRAIVGSTSPLDSLGLQEVEPLNDVVVGVPPVLFATTSPPILPVVVWRLSTGEVWVTVDSGSKDEVSLLAGGIVVSEESGGLPHVDLLSPLAAGNMKDPVQREAYLLPDVTGSGIGAQFTNAGPFGADLKTNTGGVYSSTVSTSTGVAVMCTGDPDSAADIDATASLIASSIAAST